MSERDPFEPHGYIRFRRGRIGKPRHPSTSGERYRPLSVDGFECCDMNFRSEEARAEHRELRGCEKLRETTEERFS